MGTNKKLQFILREYKKSDKEDLIECIAELQDYERNINANKLPGNAVEEKYLEYISDMRDKNDGIILIAVINDKIVGFSCLWVEKEEDPSVIAENYIFLSDLYIKPEFRKMGIATKLIDSVKDYARLKSVSKIRVCTLAENIPIQNLLKSLRFSQYEIMWEARL